MHRYLALILFVMICSPSFGEEIPLKSIWAARMPGTTNIRELEPRTAGDNREFGPLTHTIIRTMQRDGTNGWGRPDAGPGFPVPGEGIAALNAAYDIIFHNVDRPATVQAGEVTIVFFARRSGQHCYLEKVEREGNVITLTYRFHLHRTAHVAAYFALIPLGKLEPGTYEVQMEQLPMARPVGEPSGLIEGERLKQTVSEPFTFEVE